MSARRSFTPGPLVVNGGNGADSAGGIETLPRWGLSGFAGVSGQLWLCYVTAARPVTLTKLMVASGDTAAATATLGRMGLFTAAADGAVTLVARTASDTTIGASTYSPYERALATAGGYPASYRLAAGKRYALGWLQLAATPMAVQGAYLLDPDTAPIMCRVVTGQTDILASYAAGSLASSFKYPYMRGRP